MTLFTSILYAQEVAGNAKAPAGGMGGLLIPMLLMIAIFYFLIIRPQQKKEKDRKKMVDQLAKGDRVITAGGIYGTITSVKSDQNIVVVKISDNAKVEFAKSAIQSKITSDTDGKK